MDESTWRARALIRAAALRHNLKVVKSRAPGCRVIAVIKADAYGHGMAAITGLLAEHVDAFAVATLREAIDCRALNPELPIIVLSEFHRPEHLEMMGRHRLQPVLNDVVQVAWLEAYRGPILDPWIKVDTGMHRLGVRPEQVEGAVRRAIDAAGTGTVRLMSHLANGDDTDDDMSVRQCELFRACTEQFGLERSMANSAGVMHWPESHFDWVRPGIMLYGGSPMLGRGGRELGLQPVMQLEAHLLSVKKVAAGKPIGYGGTYITPAEAIIGLAGFGYGDGYPRGIEAGAEVTLRGQRVPIVGRVAMDLITVDLTGFNDVQPGETLVLWGDDPGVDEVAAWAATIPYELLCKVTPRIPRQVVH